jgi:HK97 family phage portal protein
MLERIRGLFGKQATPARPDRRSAYLKASLGIISGGPGTFGRSGYSTYAAVGKFRSWIFAAASINAFGVSSVPLRLYVRGGPGRKLFRSARVRRDRKAYLLGDAGRSPSRTVLAKMTDFGADFEEVTEAHPVLDLLRKVNPAMNGFDLAATRTLWQELTGNAYLNVIPNALGVPAELWPMPPQWVEIVTSDTKFVDAYLYGRERQNRIRLEPEAVLHFKRPNPGDLHYGLGKVEAAWGVAELNAAIHEMDLALAANNARPDYLAVIKNTDAGEDALEEFERAVNEKLRGPSKAGQFMAMTGDIDLKPMQFPPKDVGGREDIVEEIAAVFGVPVSMLKANDPNLASATTGFAQWRESTILPLLRLDEEVLNQRLLPLFGLEDDAVLAYDDPVPANRQLDLTEHATLVQAGVLTVDEVREARGYEPLGEELYGDEGATAEGGSDEVDGQTPGGTQPIATPAPATVGTASGPPPAAPLNGAQIQAATETLLAVTAGSLAPAAAEALLVALGLDAGSAARMVAAQAAIAPSDITPIPEAVSDVEPPPAAATPDATKAVAASAPAKYSEIDFTPTEEMSSAAERGLRLRAEFNRGGTEVGVARATQLKNREVLSPDTVRRMASYFARHAVDERAGWDDPADPSAGFIAWLLWGGDAGRDWASRVVERMDKADDDAAGSKGCGCGTKHGRTVRQSELWAGRERFTKATGESREEAKIVDRLQKALADVGRERIAKVVKALLASGSTGWELMDRALRELDPARLRRDLKVAAWPHVASVFRLGAAKGEDAFERAAVGGGLDIGDAVGFEFTNPEVSKWIDRSTTRLATAVGGSTTRRVRSLIGTGLEDGSTVQEIAAGLEEKGFSDDRALTIARTETARAYVQGEVEAWRQTGMVKGKEWLLAPDPCPYCEALAKQSKDKGLADTFLKVGDTVTASDGSTYVADFESVTGPPLHPNCRCDLLPVLEELPDES